MEIVFTVCNRPDYLRETLESWSRVRGIGGHHLTFFCEPVGDESVAACREVDFASSSVLVNSVRLGVASNPWNALESSFRAHGSPFTVIAEEDTPVADDVLEYFTWARDRFAARNVMTVCAHQLGHVPPPSGTAADVFLIDWFSPVVWGTWKDRWDTHLRGSWDFDYSHQGWDNQVNMVTKAAGYVTAFPSRSRSQHIGERSGAHCSPGFFPNTVSQSFAPHYDPQDYVEVGYGHDSA